MFLICGYFAIFYTPHLFGSAAVERLARLPSAITVPAGIIYIWATQPIDYKQISMVTPIAVLVNC